VHADGGVGIAVVPAVVDAAVGGLLNALQYSVLCTLAPAAMLHALAAMVFIAHKSGHPTVEL